MLRSRDARPARGRISTTHIHFADYHRHRLARRRVRWYEAASIAHRIEIAARRRRPSRFRRDHAGDGRRPARAVVVLGDHPSAKLIPWKRSSVDAAPDGRAASAMFFPRGASC